jgi:hypothetical protein
MRPRQHAQPAADEHVQQAREFFRFYERLVDEGEELGWAVVVLFYTALHLVQAYAVRRGERPTGHDERRGFIARKLPSLVDPYRRLETESQRARYRLRKPDAARLEDCYRHDFLPIVEELRSRGITW